MGHKTSILDGQVVITAKGRTAKVVSAIYAFEAVEPEYEKTMPEVIRGHFVNCIHTFPATVDVEFNLTDRSPAVLYDWQAFWEQCKGSTDYAAVWDAYQENITMTVGNAWFDAVNGANDLEYLAPEVLRKDDKELDPKNA